MAIIDSEPNYTQLNQVSSQAKDFIRQALKKDQNERATIAELLSTEWISNRLSAKKAAQSGEPSQ